MNIYEKLNEARRRFREEGFKKGGVNGFAHYNYFQLKDILGATVKICSELKIICCVSFGAQEAVMEVIDCEKPLERITFTSPMSRANLKGCHEVQNLGAVETYIRRYLYMTAFEIDECDPSEDLDSGAVQMGDSTSTPSDKGAAANGGASSTDVQGSVHRDDFAEIDAYINTYGQRFQSMPTKDGKSNVLEVLLGIVKAGDKQGASRWLPWLRTSFGALAKAS